MWNIPYFRIFTTKQNRPVLYFALVLIALGVASNGKFLLVMVQHLGLVVLMGIGWALVILANLKYSENETTPVETPPEANRFMIFLGYAISGIALLFLFLAAGGVAFGQEINVEKQHVSHAIALAFIGQKITNLAFWVVAVVSALIFVGVAAGVTRDQFTGIISKTIKIVTIAGVMVLVLYVAGLYLTDPGTDLRRSFESVEFDRLLSNLQAFFEGMLSIALTPGKAVGAMADKGGWTVPFMWTSIMVSTVLLVVSMRHERFRPTRFYLIVVGTGLMTAGMYFAGSSSSNFQDMLKNLNATEVWFPLVMAGGGIFLILRSVGEQGDFVEIFNSMFPKAVLAGLILIGVWYWAGIRGVELKGVQDIPAFIGEETGRLTAQALGDQCFEERQSARWTKVFDGMVSVASVWALKLNKSFAGQEILVCARGKAIVSSQKGVTPAGVDGFSRRFIRGEREWVYPSGCTAYSLMLKVKTPSTTDADPIFCIGSKQVITPPKGTIFFGVQDMTNRMYGNRGSWDVEIFREIKACLFGQAWLCRI